MSHHKVYEKRPFDPELEPISQSSPWSSQDASHRRRQCGGWHLLEKRLTVVVICLAYTIVGPTMIVVNNHIIKALHFPYPLLLSCVGLFTTASACAFKVRVWPWLRDCCHPKRYDDDLQQQDAEAADPLLVDRASAPASDSGLTGVRGGGVGGGGGEVSAIQPMTRRFWLYNMVPIGIAQGLTFACGNAAYMYLTITFTQMLSAFTPSVTLLLLYLSGVEIPTIRATCAVLVICVGCLISSYGEVNFDPTGVTFRCIGILMEAIRLVLTQKLLKQHEMRVVESQYYLAPIGCGCLLLGAAFTEVPRAWEEGAFGIARSHPLAFIASATLGLAASFMTFLVIKVTNSVTLKVLNTARNGAFVLFTVNFLHEEASNSQIFGYSVSIAAFCSYSFFRITGG